MASDPSFRMTVEDIFLIRGRGTVVTGRVESGTLKVGDTVQLRRQSTILGNTVVTGIEMLRKLLDQASPGDNVGLLLRDVTRDEVQRGDVLVGVEFAA